MKPFIDKSVQLLFGRMPGIQVLPRGIDEESRRHADGLEAAIYATWEANDAQTEFMKAAHDSFLLRRGLIYVFWDSAQRRVRFRSVTPDHFFPVYDGTETVEAIYVTRRRTSELQKQYPKQAADIVEDQGHMHPAMGDFEPHQLIMRGQTTVIDWFSRSGEHARLMGEVFMKQDLFYGFDSVPFLEFPCFPVGGEREPLNLIDQIIELNQYLDQLISQKADIIRRYSNPTVIAKDTGQSPDAIRATIQADGGVLPIKATGDVSLLNWPGTPPAIDEQMTMVLDMLFDLAGKPRSSFGQTVTNQSGVVTNLMLTPTLQSNDMHETIWGRGLSRLDEWILRLWERFMASEELEFKGSAPTGFGSAMAPFQAALMGADIDGWYKNRMKWPSAIRVDDPTYVQSRLQQVTSDPPVMSLRRYLEETGVEDVEGETDMIGQDLQDPRRHPEVLQAQMGAVESLGQTFGAQVPPPTGPAGEEDPFAAMPGMNGEDPMAGMGGPAFDPAMLDSVFGGAGNPNTDQMVQAVKGPAF